MRAKFIQNEPVWFRAVLQYPPVPLPAKAPPSRTEYDNRIPEPSYESGERTNLKRTRNKPLPIQYIEDDLRRQFFRDHPFEAFRPRTLVEGMAIEQPHSVSGKAWTRLRQRGRNPIPEECVPFSCLVPLSDFCSAIQFAMSLHEHQGLSLSDAYCRAVAQFRALRSEHHIATAYAVYEAETFGSTFGRSEIEKAFEREKEVLETWKQEEQVDESARMATKRWRAIIERDPGEGNWTKGEEYVRLWKANIEPECAPQLTEPMTEASADTVPP